MRFRTIIFILILCNTKSLLAAHSCKNIFSQNISFKSESRLLHSPNTQTSWNKQSTLVLLQSKNEFEILDTKNFKVKWSFELEKNSDYLTHWSVDGKQLALVKKSFENTNRISAFVFDVVNGQTHPLFTEIPYGYLWHPQKEWDLFWSPNSRFLGFQMTISKGRKEKNIAAIFDTQVNQLTAVIGFQKDPRSLILNLNWSEENPNQVFARIGHEQYINIGFELWDLSKSQKLNENHNIWMDHHIEMVREFKHQEISSHMIKSYQPNESDAFLPHMFKSPNGEYYLKVSQMEENTSPRKWALDIVKKVRGDETRPFKEALLDFIPTEFNPSNLNIHWIHKGEILLVYGEGYLWYWNYQKKHIEVQLADDYLIQNDKLIISAKSKYGQIAKAYYLENMKEIGMSEVNAKVIGLDKNNNFVTANNETIEFLPLKPIE